MTTDANIFLQVIIPKAVQNNNLTLLLKISTLQVNYNDYSVRRIALEYVSRLIEVSGKKLPNIDVLLQEFEPLMRKSLDEMRSEPVICALCRQKAYAQLIVHIYLKWLMKEVTNEKIKPLLMSREQTANTLKNYMKDRVEPSREYIEQFKYIGSLLDHCLMHRLTGNSWLSIKRKLSMTKVQLAKNLLDLIEFLFRDNLENVHLKKEILTKCRSLNPWDLHVFIHFIVCKVSTYEYYGMKLLPFWQTLYLLYSLHYLNIFLFCGRSAMRRRVISTHMSHS